MRTSSNDQTFSDESFPDIFVCEEWQAEVPKEIRKVIEQEYLVNPERARYFFENAKTYCDIQRLRTEVYRSYGIAAESSISAMEDF